MLFRSTTSPKAAFDAGKRAGKGTDEALAVGREQMEALKAQAETSGRAFFKVYGDLAAFNQENVEALIRSGSIMAKGAEDIGKQMVAFGQASLETGMATGKAMMSAKTLRELADLQTEYARNSLDSVLAESTRLSEMSARATNEALELLGARLGAAVGKFGKPLAA